MIHAIHLTEAPFRVSDPQYIAFFVGESGRWNDDDLICADCARRAPDYIEWMAAVPATDAASIAGETCAECRRTFPITPK